MFVAFGVVTTASLAGCTDKARSSTAPVSISAAEVAGNWAFTLTRDRNCSGEGVTPGTMEAQLRATERGDTVSVAGSWIGPFSQAGPWPLLGVIDRRTGIVLIDFWSLVNQYGWRATGTITTSLRIRGRGVDPIPGSDPFFTEPPCGYSLSAEKVR